MGWIWICKWIFPWPDVTHMKPNEPAMEVFCVAISLANFQKWPTYFVPAPCQDCWTILSCNLNSNHILSCFNIIQFFELINRLISKPIMQQARHVLIQYIFLRFIRKQKSHWNVNVHLHLHAIHNVPNTHSQTSSNLTVMSDVVHWRLYQLKSCVRSGVIHLTWGPLIQTHRRHQLHLSTLFTPFSMPHKRFALRRPPHPTPPLSFTALFAPPPSFTHSLFSSHSFSSTTSHPHLFSLLHLQPDQMLQHNV